MVSLHLVSSFVVLVNSKMKATSAGVNGKPLCSPVLLFASILGLEHNTDVCYDA